MQTERRSTRSRKTTTVLDLRSSKEDRLLRVALKRSQLESTSAVTLASHEDATAFFASLELVPTVVPSIEEFNDPIGLWETLNTVGIQYGAIKLVPPDGWKPPFCLDFNNLKFKAREQHLHKLVSGNAFKFPKSVWTAKDFREYSDQFKSQYCSNSLKDKKNRKRNLSDFEIEYWRFIETQSSPMSVFYGADIEVSEVGSGFPTNPVLHNDTDDERNGINNNQEKSSLIKNERKGEILKDGNHDLPIIQNEIKRNEHWGKNSIIDKNDDVYSTHPWNLLNLPKVDGSLLQSFPRVIPGVTCPWLYIGMLFSSFCWHTEDNYFAAVNYQHLGDEKVWYVIPPSYAPQMEKLMRDYLGHKKPEEVLHSLAIQLSPGLLTQNGIKVNRIVQKENEFVLLWPRTFHCGFNTGFNCNEACNVAPPIWLDWGHLAVNAYRHLRTMCIPYEQLIYMASIGTTKRKDMIQKLIESLKKIIIEDYSRRQDAPPSLLQFPLTPSRFLTKYLPPLEDCKHKSSTAMMGVVRRSAGDNAKLRECFDSVCSNSIHLFESDDQSFLKQFDALTQLPCLDCDYCRSACYQGFVSCTHNDNVSCLPCFNSMKSLECRCSSKVFLYRFPLRAQLRILRRLQRQLDILNGKKLDVVETEKSELDENEIEDQNQKQKIDENNLSELIMEKIPSYRSVELLEKQRAAPIRLGLVGPFIWRSSSSEQITIPILTPTDSSILQPSSLGLFHGANSMLENQPIKRPRGRPRSNFVANSMNVIPLDIPHDLGISLTPDEFRTWIGLGLGEGKIPIALRPPSKDFDIKKNGANDIVCRLSSRHLFGALLDEFNESDSSESEINDRSDGDENQQSGNKRNENNKNNNRDLMKQNSMDIGQQIGESQQMKRKRGRPRKNESGELNESGFLTSSLYSHRRKRRKTKDSDSSFSVDLDIDNDLIMKDEDDITEYKHDDEFQIKERKTKKRNRNNRKKIRRRIDKDDDIYLEKVEESNDEFNARQKRRKTCLRMKNDLIETELIRQSLSTYDDQQTKSLLLSEDKIEKVKTITGSLQMFHSIGNKVQSLNDDMLQHQSSIRRPCLVPVSASTRCGYLSQPLLNSTVARIPPQQFLNTKRFSNIESINSAASLLNGKGLLKRANRLLEEDREKLKSTVAKLLCCKDSQMLSVLGSKMVALDQGIKDLEQSIQTIRDMISLQNKSVIDSKLIFNNKMSSAIKTLLLRLRDQISSTPTSMGEESNIQPFQHQWNESSITRSQKQEIDLNANDHVLLSSLLLNKAIAKSTVNIDENQIRSHEINDFE